MPTTRAQRRAAATNGTAKARPARTSKSSHVDAPATARKGASRRGRNKRSNSGSNTAGSSSARAPATRPQGGRGSRRVQAEGKPLHGVGAGVEDIVLNPSEWCCSGEIAMGRVWYSWGLRVHNLVHTECGTTDDLSICLRCGFIGCGRYAHMLNACWARRMRGGCIDTYGAAVMGIITEPITRAGVIRYDPCAVYFVCVRVCV